VLSALIFNAMIIPALIPLACAACASSPDQRDATAAQRNMLVYGVGGVLLPFVAIKLIDVLLSLSLEV
jgi:K+-transporting ATPase ATPase B chain